MFATVRPALRALLVISAAAGIVIAIWLTFQLAGWSEDGVVGWIPESSVAAAVVIVGLLVADTALPVPATLVMLASGAVFGPIGGSAVNAIGLAVAALAGYWIGSRFSRADAAVVTSARHPLWMVAATRGVPVLSESFAIGAGVLGFPVARFTRAAVLGAVAAGAVYGTAGWLAKDHWILVIAASVLAGGTYVVASRQLRALRSSR